MNDYITFISGVSTLRLYVMNLLCYKSKNTNCGNKLEKRGSLEPRVI